MRRSICSYLELLASQIRRSVDHDTTVLAFVRLPPPLPANTNSSGCNYLTSSRKDTKEIVGGSHPPVTSNQAHHQLIDHAITPKNRNTEVGATAVIRRTVSSCGKHCLLLLLKLNRHIDLGIVR